MPSTVSVIGPMNRKRRISPSLTTSTPAPSCMRDHLVDRPVLEALEVARGQLALLERRLPSFR